MDVSTYLQPDNYEMEEWSRPDEMAMFGGFWAAAQAELDTLPNADVAELCCGTGMSLIGVASHPNIQSVVGVDIDERNIDFCRQRFQSYGKLHFAHSDVLEWMPQKPVYDLLLLSSAFHHIEHGKQQYFADLIASSLKPGGKAVFAENVVAPYDEPLSDQYMISVEEYYEAAYQSAVLMRPDLPEQIRLLIRENVVLAKKGMVEFKICRPHFVSQLEKSGLKLRLEEKFWPVGRSLPGNAGNYIFVVDKPA